MWSIGRSIQWDQSHRLGIDSIGIVQLIIILSIKTTKNTPVYFVCLNREIYFLFIGDLAFIAYQYPNNPNGDPTVSFLGQAVRCRWLNYKSINWTYLFSLFKSLAGDGPNRLSTHYIPNSRGDDFVVYFADPCGRSIVVCARLVDRDYMINWMDSHPGIVFNPINK